MKASHLTEPRARLAVDVIKAISDEHLACIAMLRACSFYIVPEERSFAGALPPTTPCYTDEYDQPSAQCRRHRAIAGRRYQEMKAAEELVKLQGYRDLGHDACENQVSIVAIVGTADLHIPSSHIEDYLFLSSVPVGQSIIPWACTCGSIRTIRHAGCRSRGCPEEGNYRPCSGMQVAFTLSWVHWM